MNLADRSRLSDKARSWLVVVVLTLAGTSASFMQTLVVPLQNHLPELLGEPRTATAWVLTISLVAAAISNPISGKLADLFGKRNMVMVLLGLMTVGSVIAALSDGLFWMLVGRTLQGFSMGVIAAGISILGQLPDSRVGLTGIGFMSASLGFGGALGLPLAALIIELGNWKLLFWASAVLGLINLIAVALCIPGQSSTRQRFDVVGAILLAAALAGVLTPVSQGPVWGWTSSLTLGMLTGGIVLLIIWGVYQLRISQPLVDLRLLSQRTLLMVNSGSIVFGLAFFVQEVAMIQILELPSATEAGLGLTMFWASVALVPSALAMMAVAPFASHITRRHGARVTATLGSALTGVGYLVPIIWHTEIWHIIVSSVFALAGVGMGYAAIPTLVMAEVPDNTVGSANGVNALMRSIGTSSGAMLTGMILAAQTETSAGIAAPSQNGFVTVFVLGFAAACASALLLWFSSTTKPGRI